MLSESTLRDISHVFCGDSENFFSYKSGPKLIGFFNTHFGYNDKYQQGFPSRWSYVYDKLIELLNKNIIDKFFNIVLSKEFLMSDSRCSEVEAVSKSQEIFNYFNNVLSQDMFLLSLSPNGYHLISQNMDLKLIGSGGYANVYKQKSTGLILKKLKDDFLSDAGIRSRFKREFEITKSLQGLHGIINTYSFDASTCSYTMEEAEQTLEKYVNLSNITEEIKLKCIRQILYIMTSVHKRNIIHRDLSPNNIFIIQGLIKIADFGLGKDLNVFTSHQTLHTNSVGQYWYCAPEQFMLLKDGDKRSDVYSLGRLINFIMTGEPTNSHHIYRSVSEKATSGDASYRYADAEQLSMNFEKSVKYHQDKKSEESVFEKISKKIFDSDIDNFIFEQSSEKLCGLLLEERRGMKAAFINFMKCDDNHSEFIIQSIDRSYRDVCGWSFKAYDPFADFAYEVLKGDFAYIIKEIAANILRYVAKDVKRFSAQHMLDEVKELVEPSLVEILAS